MNMKKSIAGVMAGALAVSAIATTASAWTGGSADQEQIVLSYDLNKEGHAWNAGSATLKYTYAPSDVGYEVLGLDTNAKVNVKVGAKIGNINGVYTLDTATIAGTGFKQADGNSDTAQRTFVRSAKIGTDGKNETIMPLYAGTHKDANGNIYAFDVPFTKGTDNMGFNMDRFKMNDAPATSDYEVYVETCTTAAAAATEGAWTDVVDNLDPAVATATANGLMSSVKPLAEAAVGDVTGVQVVDGTTAGTKKVQTKACTAAAVKAVYGAPTLVQTVSSKDAAEALVNQLVAAQVTSGTLEGQAGHQKYTISAKAGTGATTAVKYGFKNYEITLGFTINYADNTGEWDKGEWELGWAVNAELSGIDGMANNTYSANFTKPTYGTFYSPMRTDWNAPADVITRLTDLGYTYPQAVLNDVIANNENVAFTFTTAQKYVDNREYIKVDGDYTSYDDVNNSKIAVVENPMGGKSLIKYTGAIYRNGGDVYIKNPYYGVAYDGNKKNDFTNKSDALWYNPVFNQGLYQKFTWNGNNGYTASGPNGSQGSKDQFGSYASIWNTNLNSAGLVANSRWTMQLSDVDAFEWGDSTITFFWDAITDEANVTNAANFLQSLQLYTPNEWFWDKMDVAVGAAIAEDVGADAPLEEEAEEVSEEEVTEEEIIEEEEEPIDDFEEEEPVDDFEDDFTEEEFDETEPEIEDEPEVTEPVEEAPANIEVDSPKTGNAPVALAVIPVALAAAAVVAKKRK